MLQIKDHSEDLETEAYEATRSRILRDLGLSTADFLLEIGHIQSSWLTPAAMEYHTVGVGSQKNFNVAQASRLQA